MMTPTMYSSNARAYAPRIQSPLAVPLPSSSRPRDQWEVDNWLRTPPTFGPGPDFTYDTRFYDVDPLDPTYDLTLDPPAHGGPPPASLADYLLPERKQEMQDMLEVANAEPMFAEGGESLLQEHHARVALGRPPLRPDLRLELESQQQGLDAFQVRLFWLLQCLCFLSYPSHAGSRSEASCSVTYPRSHTLRRCSSGPALPYGPTDARSHPFPLFSYPPRSSWRC